LQKVVVAFGEFLMIIANKIAQDLRALGMSQTNLARLSHVSPDRLSRFLNESLNLRPDEVDRLTNVLQKCARLESGDGRLGTFKIPIDWDRMILNPAATDDQSSDIAQFEFEGDIDFTLDRHPVLTVLLPLDVLKSLVSAGPSRFLKITQSEVVALLGLIVRNPETSDDNKVAAQSLLDLSNQGAGDDD
jgi:transcriptional regulator with XRE-family HTH domain